MQGLLFDSAIQEAMRQPIAASVDPEPSHQAAKEITESGKREGQLQGVLALVRQYPGRTAVELAAKSCYDRYTINRRLPELEHAGLVRKAGQRACQINQRLACIWEAHDVAPTSDTRDEGF